MWYSDAYRSKAKCVNFLPKEAGERAGGVEVGQEPELKADGPTYSELC